MRHPRCLECRRLIRVYPVTKSRANIRLTASSMSDLYALADEFDAAGDRYTAREFVDYFAPDVTHLRRHA
jgi:hypothetical protein